MALSGIHTHSGPGGYLQYILYIITSLGFVRESFDVLVAGIVQVRLCMPSSLLFPVPRAMPKMPELAAHNDLGVMGGEHLFMHIAKAHLANVPK